MARADAPEEPVEPPAQFPERRLVSVLFLDLVSFTTLSEQRDAEDMRELLSAYFDTARTVIERHGGVIEKFIGDAVMAVWGTPVAREDDAERAVRTAMELVDAVAELGASTGTPLRARGGVLTGEAATMPGGMSEGMVTGDMVNTASRLQSAAEPGQVFVGEATFRASSRAIAFDDVGDLALKGKEAPVHAWRALRVFGERRGANPMAVEPPFVGRTEQLRLLKELLHATEREGKVRVVSVTGIGGIGKSRLAWELFNHVDGLSETFYSHEGEPGLRRRHHLLGAGRDGTDAGRDRRDRSPWRVSHEAGGLDRRARSGPGRPPMARAALSVPARPRGASGRRPRRSSSQPGGPSSSGSVTRLRS